VQKKTNKIERLEMEKNTKVSIIIPIYNMEKYLEECLDTAIGQTLKDIEIICVNDGSQDNSLSIIKKYMAIDDRIVLIDQENLGVATARNNAMNIATGEFICFMDPDDWYPESDILETLYITAKEHNVNICGGSFSEYYPNGDVITDFKLEKSKYKFDKDMLMFYNQYQFEFGYHRFVYKTEFLRKHNIYFPQYVRFQDPPFFITAMVNAKKFYAISKVTYAYRAGNFKTIQWTERKASDLFKGLIDNLRLSNEYGLNELHYMTAKRLSVNYKDIFIDVIHEVTDTKNFLNLVGNAENVANYTVLKKDGLDEKYREFLKTLYYLLWTNEVKDAIGYENSNIDDKFDVIRKSDNVKVSVIVPFYNDEKYVSDCLESLRDQTMKELQIICVNDGSQDNSRSIVEEFSKYDERIEIIDKENGGLSSARNVGISRAKGKYLMFLDSDDYLDLDSIRYLYTVAEQDDTDIIDFDAVAFFETKEDEEKNSNYKSFYERKYNSNEVCLGEEYFSECIQNNDFKPSVCLHFMKTSFIKDNGITFYEGILHEDNLFTLQSLLMATRVKYINKKYYYRRVHEDSIMTRETTMKNIYGYFVTIYFMLDFANNYNFKLEGTKDALSKELSLIYRNNVLSKMKKFEDDNIDLYTDDYMQKMYFDVFIKTSVNKIKALNEKYQEVRNRPNGIIKNDEIDTLRKTNNSLVDKNNWLIQKKDEIESDRDRILNSYSYRLGMLVTWIPRKIRRFLRICLFSLQFPK
jgi:glycosyltransferase involved in cell wall biosynthesis